VQKADVRLILLAGEERYDLELRLGVMGAEGGTEKDERRSAQCFDS